MCPGLTHPNAKMTPVGENTVVAIMAEGKDHALAIGKTVMSTQVTKYSIPRVDFIKAKSWAQSHFTLCAELLRSFFIA